MDNNGLNAGVRLGGLTDRTEIKILLCYLLSALNRPITQNQLIECVCGQELVNYFEMQSALSHLIEQKFVTENSEGFSITREGREIAQQLESTVSATVKRYAYRMAVSLLQYEALKKQNKTSIYQSADGNYFLKCSIDDDNFSIFSMEIPMPDEKTAKYAAQQFILNGGDIFKCVLGIITDTPSMYSEFLKDKNQQ